MRIHQTTSNREGLWGPGPTPQSQAVSPIERKVCQS